MAFVWIQGTAVDDIIHKADIDEIHTNIDSIKDNLANITHDSGVLSTHRGTYLLDNYTNHNTDQDIAHFDVHDVLNHTTHYSSNNSGQNSGYNGTDYSSDYADYCAEVEISRNKTECPEYGGGDPIWCDTLGGGPPCSSHNRTDYTPDLFHDKAKYNICPNVYSSDYTWNNEDKTGCGPYKPSCIAY